MAQTAAVIQRNADALTRLVGVEDRKKVNIYIATSIIGPRRADGLYMYLLETLVWRTQCGKREQVTCTRQQMAEMKATTENELAVSALEAALCRLTAPCDLAVWTDCPYVAGILEARRYEEWRAHGWQGTNGKPIKYVDKWLRISELLNAHGFEVKLKERHGYTDWMKREMKKHEV